MKWLSLLPAFSVHVFTSSGIVVGFYAIVAAAEGDLRRAMALLFVCQLIDGIDGTFARLFRVRERLPWMDGKTIDYVIDFATYAVIPAYILYQSGALPPAVRDVAITAILLVSALYYGMHGMVSDDMHFVGFPVMWNFAVFYLVFVTDWPPMANFAVVLLLCALHFVPIKFAYPSRSVRFFWPHLIASAVCVATCVAILFLWPEKSPWLNGLALASAVYFGAMGVFTTWFVGDGPGHGPR
jgi:phosphatidylcholine synthase